MVKLHVPSTVNAMSFLHNQIITTLQQPAWLDGIIFMQDGALLHVAKSVMQLLKRHFGSDTIISLHFHTARPSRSSNLNACDFWLWSYLKNICYLKSVA